MSANKIDQLAEALVAARNAAQSITDPDDGGTCNLDSPAFRVERIREATVEAAAAKAGVRVSSFTWYGKKWFWVTGLCEGQGNRRARMAQAAANALKEFEGQIKGFRATCYCAMD